MRLSLSCATLWTTVCLQAPISISIKKTISNPCTATPAIEPCWHTPGSALRRKMQGRWLDSLKKLRMVPLAITDATHCHRLEALLRPRFERELNPQRSAIGNVRASSPPRGVAETDDPWTSVRGHV